MEIRVGREVKTPNLDLQMLVSFFLSENNNRRVDKGPVTGNGPTGTEGRADS